MRTTNHALLIMILLLYLAEVKSMIRAGQNPVCPSYATLQIKTSTPTLLSFDVARFYYSDQSYDSNQLFMDLGGPNKNFKLKRYDQSIENIIGQKQCDQSSGNYEFVALVNEVLVLRDNEGKYYACKYDQSTASPLPKLILQYPMNYTFPSIIKPYYWDAINNWLMMSVSYNGKGGYFSYTWPSSPTTGIKITPIRRGQQYNNQIQKVQGTTDLIYDENTNSIQTFVSNNFVTDSTNYPISTGQTVKLYPLRNIFCGITILNPDLKSGKLYFVNIITAVDTINLPNVDARIYEFYTQTVSNLVAVNNNLFYWGNVDPSGNKISSLLTTNDIDTKNLKYLGLAGNKAVLLYENKVEYYQIKNNEILFVFSRQMSIKVETQGQQVLALTCMCSGIKNFICNSLTLNCLILKRADKNCSTVDDLTI